MLVYESRASLILFNVLKTLNTSKIFLLPLNVCPIVPAVFLKANISFEFIDISNESLCMDPLKLYVKLKSNEKYGGVLFVKTFGTELNSEIIFNNIKEINKDIFIIDDRCLSIPEFDDNINASNADLILYSTGYSKFIDLGWGGFGYINENMKYNSHLLNYDELALDELTSQFQVSLANNSKIVYSDTDWLGSNEKLFTSFDEYKRAVEAKIKPMQEHKKKLDSIYKNGLPSEIILGDKFNTWRFSILIENKNILLDCIFENNLFASSHYSSLEYMFSHNVSEKSNAFRIHENIVNLFNDFRYTVEEAERTVRVINNFLKDNK